MRWNCPNQPNSGFFPQNGASLSNRGWGYLVPSSSFGHWWQLSRQGVEQVSASRDWRVKMLVTVSLTLYSFLMPYLSPLPCDSFSVSLIFHDIDGTLLTACPDSTAGASDDLVLSDAPAMIMRE